MGKLVYKKILVISVSLVVSLVTANIAFLVVVSLVGIFPGNEVMSYVVIFAAILLAFISGILCFKNIFKYMNRETKSL
jgi:hypothetical protein